MTIANEDIFSIISQNSIHPGAPEGSWKTEDWVYDKIRMLPGDNEVSLETGAGASTLFFALSKVKKHYCLVPSLDEVNKIRNVASIAKISLDKVDFKVSSSVDTLTGFSKSLDFVFIDGCHGPFLPFLDFYFSVKNLRAGGLVLIDDIDLIAPKILFEFIQSEPSVHVLSQSKKAALVKINSDIFLDFDWWQSSIRYICEEPILTDQLFLNCTKHS